MSWAGSSLHLVIQCRCWQAKAQTGRAGHPTEVGRVRLVEGHKPIRFPRRSDRRD